MASSRRKTPRSLFKLVNLKIWTLTLKVKSRWMRQSRLINLLKRPLRRMSNNWYRNKQIHRRTTPMIFNCRCHWPAETTPSTWEPSTWDRPSVSQLELFSILDLSTWLLPVHCATIPLPAISNLRSTTHYPANSCRETSLTRDARLKLTICINPTLIRSSRRHLQNLLMAQPNCRVSSGKITLASSR